MTLIRIHVPYFGSTTEEKIPPWLGSSVTASSHFTGTGTEP